MPQTEANKANWPIRYPAIITKKIRVPPQYQGQGYLETDPGDEVMCTSKVRTDSRGVRLIQVLYPKLENGQQGRHGFVQQDALKIGNVDGPIIGDEMTVNLGDPSYIDISNTAFAANTDSGLLYDTVLGLFTAWHENLQSLPKVPLYLEKNWIHTSQARQNLARQFCHSVKLVNPELLDLLNSGNFDLRDIGSKAKVVSTGGQHSGKTGIYTIVAAEFRGQPTRLPEQYVGKSAISFSKRYNEHEAEKESGSPKGVHYQAAARALFYEMYALCFLDVLKEDPSNERFNIFEQVCLNLFETTCASVRNLRSVSNTIDDTADDEVNENGDRLTRAAKYALDKDLALVFANLASQVFARTGWPGGCRRSDTAIKHYGCIAGLNWKMPLTEKVHSKIVWTKVTKPGKFAEFRRVDCRIPTDGDRRFMVLHFYNQDRSRSLINFYLPKDVGPPGGTVVHTVVELRLDGQLHAIPHGRQTTVGPMSDFREASEVGMRIEWKDASSGRWMQEYVQMRNQYNRQERNAPAGINEGYARCTALRAFLLQEDRAVKDRFPWMLDFGIAKIKRIEIDHLKQEITSTLQVTAGNPRPANKPLEFCDLQKQQTFMQRLGVQYSPAPFLNSGNYPPIDQAFRGVKGLAAVKCDWCQFGFKISKLQLYCRKVDGRDICKDCQRVGRSCHFTHNTTMRASEELQRASFTPPEARRGPLPAPDRLLIEY